MDEIERCRCDAQATPCTNRVTQEGRRCDNCRDGCMLLLGDGWSAHVGVEVSVILVP